MAKRRVSITGLPLGGAPFDYHGDLDHARPGDVDHARATSNGTYLEGINEGLEPLDEYRDGGYHPIHLGDTLGASGRYRVLHKLGHGGFGTVWLCRDTRDAGYVAVKVMVGDVTPETIPDLTLARLDRSAPGAEYIAIPLDSFSLEGPNGSHQCIVLPVLGPCVSPSLWFRIKNEPGPVLRGMAQQAARAMDFLHKNGLCHGDFRPSNILVKLTRLNKLTEDELLSLLGQPQRAQVRTESGEDLPASSPQYLTHAADLSRLGEDVPDGSDLRDRLWRVVLILVASRRLGHSGELPPAGGTTRRGELHRPRLRSLGAGMHAVRDPTADSPLLHDLRPGRADSRDGALFWQNAPAFVGQVGGAGRLL
ncbi:hypothetical protein VTK73DRAFT_7297 [Phialemonium thermophilum]|uniref:EKC/KEOPS complex subunit BUD32 n=1 Tax=Phialemonium thermophilum TaxID=223376 RepID=A0ABR3WF55_9PEZI